MARLFHGETEYWRKVVNWVNTPNRVEALINAWVCCVFCHVLSSMPLFLTFLGNLSNTAENCHLKMVQKGLNIEFLDQKLLLAKFFLSGIAGYPPPLNGKYFCNFSLAKKGGTPSPLVVFDRFPINPYLFYCLHPLAQCYGLLTMGASLWGLLVLWLLLQWTTTIIKSPPFPHFNTWDVFRLAIIIIINIIFFIIIKNDIEIAINILWFCDLV